jgi:NADH-quinone oxidoreductase subunit J
MGLSFIVLFIWILVSALGILLTKKMMNALIYFLSLMLAVVGIYILLEADIMAISHLVLYVGGIIVLIMLGLMLAENRFRETDGKNLIIVNRFPLTWGIIIGLSFTGLILYGINEIGGGLIFENSFGYDQTSIDLVGRSLLTNLFFPFEYIGIFLLISLFLATYIAKKHE